MAPISGTGDGGGLGYGEPLALSTPHSQAHTPEARSALHTTQNTLTKAMAHQRRKAPDGLPSENRTPRHCVCLFVVVVLCPTNM